MNPGRLLARGSAGWRLLRRDGARAVSVRVVRLAYRKLGADSLEFPLKLDDVADSTRLQLATPDSRPDRSRPLTIGWLATPPSFGSGGHTTMFRMIEGLEAAGHTCILYLYDRFSGDINAHRDVVRQGWPSVRCEVRDISEASAPLDGWVATSWQTAHVLANRVRTPTRRFYFVQDFEPFFYARGSEYALAEDSYRFGYRCIAIGHMVADVLAAEVGVKADVAEFGCDTEVYHLVNRGARSGVVFYTRPDVPRRGYLLGLLALAEFHRRHPEQPIHVFGEAPRGIDFPVVVHSKLSPAGLNELYNQTIAGFAMSFTNISLVAEEMLAAGTVAVVNDSPYARADLPSQQARWAAPTPGALADALCELVEAEDLPGQAAAAAADVRSTGWRPAQAAVVAAIEDEIYG